MFKPTNLIYYRLLMLSVLLKIPLSLDASSYLALFRYEQVMHVKWAGAPHKKVGVHPVTNRPSLQPRTSFAIWTEEVCS